MKNLSKQALTLGFLLAFPFLAKAQFVEQNTRSTNQNPLAETPPTYIGLGMGINDYGIGFTLERHLQGPFSGFVNLGLGGWGIKFGFGGTYYLRDNYTGPALQLGFATASGADAIEFELATEPNGAMEKVKMDLHRVNTINLQYSYTWALAKRFKINTGIGYAFNLTPKSYTVLTPGVQLSPISKTSLRISEPGGLILGLRFLVGIG